VPRDTSGSHGDGDYWNTLLFGFTLHPTHFAMARPGLAYPENLTSSHGSPHQGLSIGHFRGDTTGLLQLQQAPVMIISNARHDPTLDTVPVPNMSPVFRLQPLMVCDTFDKPVEFSSLTCDERAGLLRIVRWRVNEQTEQNLSSVGNLPTSLLMLHHTNSVSLSSHTES
jgi:hypothetical protein